MIADNIQITLRHYPSTRNYDGTYNEEDITEEILFGEINLTKKLQYNSPSGQPIDAKFGVKYIPDIDKRNDRIIWDNRIFRILDINPSTLINPGWKILNLQEVFE